MDTYMLEIKIADSRQHKCRYISAQMLTAIGTCADNYRQLNNQA